MKKGQSLIELLLVIGLAALLLPTIITGFVSSRQGKPQQQQRLAASALLKEAGDAVRNLRDVDGWLSLPVADGTTVYYHHFNGVTNKWELPTAPGGFIINGFLEKIVVWPVNRDTSGAIVTSGGTIDPSTKKFDITISWSQPYQTSITSSMYLTRQEDIPLVETTQNDFTQVGTTLTGVVASSPSNNPNSVDGEMTLATGGGGDWCSPGTPSATLNLDGNGEARGVVAAPDRAFVGTGQNASGKDFYNVKVDTTGSTPSANCSTSPTCLYSPNPALKTNDVFGESIGSSRYAYLATDNNHNEIAILDVTQTTPSILQNIDVPGPVNGKSIFVAGNILYITTSDNMLYTYQLTADRTGIVPNGGHQYQGSLSLPATGNNIYVVNGIVFIAMDSTSKQFQIVDASNPTSLTLKGNLAVNSANTQIGIDITAKPDGSRAYIVVSLSTATNVAEFFIIDTDQSHNYANPTVKNSFDTHTHGDMDPYAITLVSGNKAIIVGHGGEEYQVFKNLETDSLNFCGSISMPGLDINGVSSVIGNNNKTYSYIITTDSSKEFQIIEGGSGGLYASSGTYISKTYSYPQLTSFNRLIATINQPISTATVQFQVGVATGNVSSPYCSGVTFTYVGPDSSNPSGYSTSGYYKTATTGISTITGIVPFGNVTGTYNNPGRCFSYKAQLDTSDSTQTPIFNDMTLNYSP